MPEPQQSFAYSPLRGRPELPKLEVPSLARERCATLARVCRDRSLFSEERLALLLRMADSTLAPTVLDPQSSELMIHQWNDTRIDYPRELCLHQLVEQTASC